MLLLVDFSDLLGVDNGGYNRELWWSAGQIQYIGGSLILFGSIEACECFVALLMSKVVPSALASGTFYYGLLDNKRLLFH